MEPKPYLEEIYKLISNITDNFILLKSNFIGISFNIIGVIGVVLNTLFVLSIMLVFYSIGDKIRSYFFKVNEDKLSHFINVALGYIVVSAGIAILGVLSILYKNILLAYLIIITLISLYPFSKIKSFAGRVLDLPNVLIKLPRSRDAFAFWGTAIFVIIAFLRLIPPEIGEDAIGYHTSLPSLYLKTHSILIDPKYSFNLVFPVPQLGEISYVIAQSISLKDASRYIHFTFYVLVVLLLFHIGTSKELHHLGSYAPLLFVTAPVVIQVSSRANADFQWLLCWLLAVFLITKKRLALKEIKLSAILFGGVLATKIWAIAFTPIFFVFLLVVNKDRVQGIRWGSIFLFFSFLVPSLWYIRSYFLTGNPFYPGFSGPTDSLTASLAENIGFNKLMFSYPTLITFSPLFYFGILFLFTKYHHVKKFLNTKLLLFFILLFIEHIFLVRYGFSRYLLALYSLAVLIVSFGFNSILNIQLKFAFYFLYCLLFFYYFINTIIALPYGFGWADKNRYLTRILSRDNSSYYDFDHLFDKWISDKDLVATYHIGGYYYSDFSYIDVSDIFSRNHKNFNLLKANGVTKLFINGGDISWLCKKLMIESCDLESVKLLASYPPDSKKYNLYDIKKD